MYAQIKEYLDIEKERKEVTRDWDASAIKSL